MIDQQVCLTCALPECVHDEGGPSLAQCPLKQLQPQRPGPQVPEGYLPLGKARQELRIGYKTIKRLIASGKCPAVKMGSSQRATIAIPVEWIEAQKQP